MKYIFLILFPFAFSYCNTNESNNEAVNIKKNEFAGIWKEVSQKRSKGDAKVDSDYERQFNNPDEPLVKNVYETYFIIKEKNSGFDIVREVTDQDSGEKCDSIILKENKLTFRKMNYNKSYNYFTLWLKGENTISGEMVSYNGNTYEVEYDRMPKDFKIKHTTPK